MNQVEHIYWSGTKNNWNIDKYRSSPTFLTSAEEMKKDYLIL